MRRSRLAACRSRSSACAPGAPGSVGAACPGPAPISASLRRPAAVMPDRRPAAATGRPHDRSGRRVAPPRWRMPTAGCRSPAPAWTGSCAPIPITTAAACSSASSTPASIPAFPARHHVDRQSQDSRPARFLRRGRGPLAPGDARAATRWTSAGHRLGGFGRVVALSTAGPYYAGTIAEIPLGERRPRTSTATARCATRCRSWSCAPADGWVLLADTDGDGSLAGERPVHDYLVGREHFGWAPKGARARGQRRRQLRRAGRRARRSTSSSTPVGHGTHVSGIAAGHDLYGVPGFDGVAPGAQLLGLKIANDAQGGISTTGSMLRAIDYAIRFAQARRLPLVLNMSFGVGNEIEGQARIDGSWTRCWRQHPEVVLAISAGQRRAGPLDHRLPRQRDPRAQRRRHPAGQLPAAGPRRRAGRPTCSPTSARAAARSRGPTS